jgi:hypothetical protein
MDLVFKSGQITLSTKESGAKTKPMAEESSGTLMATSTRVNGRMIRLMALEFIFTSTAPSMKVTGRTIFKTDKAWRAGKTAADMREDIRKE